MTESRAMNFLQKNIAILLTARGMTQKQLADRAGMAPSNLNRIMHGSEKVTIQRAERIAEAFGVTLSDLLDENLQNLVAVPA